jgi:hypothetical protein
VSGPLARAWGTAVGWSRPDVVGVLLLAQADALISRPRPSFPRLCTEILCSDVPSLTDILFNSCAASSQPYTCPTPLSFLLPFW